MQMPFSLNLVGGLHDDGHDPSSNPQLVNKRGIVQIQPSLLEHSIPREREFLVDVAQGTAGQAFLHDVVVNSATSGHPSRTFEPKRDGWRLPANSAYASL